MIQPLKIQIRFSDIDLMGHVNNAIYLNYFESARMHYIVQLLGTTWDWKKNGIILKTNEIEYIFPVFLEDKAEVRVHVAHLGIKSFTLTYELLVDGILKTKGKSVLVSFNFEKNQTQAIHPDFRTALEKLK